LAKEKILLLVIILSVLILPVTCFANKSIQTTQPIVVIDPGHGGSQNGLISSSGLEEKTIVLKLAQKTARKLETRYNVLLTRAGDIDMPARERIFTANKNRADLFVSIHLHNSSDPSGFFYYFNPPEPSKHLPFKTNNIWKLHPLLYQSKSKQAVYSFLNIFSLYKKPARFLSKSAPIILLEGADMPAILIEPLSISMLPQHPDEIDKILDEYALLISKSIDFYFKKIRASQ